MKKAYHEFEDIPFDEAVKLVTLPDGIEVATDEDNDWAGAIDDDGIGYTYTAKCHCGAIVFSDQGGDYSFIVDGDGSCSHELPQITVDNVDWTISPGSFRAEHMRRMYEAIGPWEIGGAQHRRFYADELPELILAALKEIEEKTIAG